MKKYDKKSLKLNFDLAGNKTGSIIQIEVDKVVINKKAEYIPIKRYWRDRLKDAALDNCVEWAKKSEVTSDENTKKAAKKPGKSSGNKT